MKKQTIQNKRSKWRLDGNLSGFQDYYYSLTDCCLEPQTKEFVDQSIKLYTFAESVPDEEYGAAITKLSNGKYATFYESQDYTGHG